MPSSTHDPITGFMESFPACVGTGGSQPPVQPEFPQTAFTLGALEKHYPPEEVARVLTSYQNEPRHVSVVRLEAWVQAEISDESLHSYLLEMKEHVVRCDRCQRNISDAVVRRRSAPDE